MTNPTTHPAPFPGKCAICSQPYAAGDPIVWLTGGADRHAGCVATDTYAAAVTAKLATERTILDSVRMDWEYARRGRADALYLDDLRRAVGRQALVVEQLEAVAS